ncbi:unnamed protein product [Gemmataceae bacterium]|nr:unnamed protein product [Gemmataceae bacterium]VTU00531.1 unnamed protein product [Gemmataceae bacterium]
MRRFPGLLVFAGVAFAVVLAAVIGAAPAASSGPVREPARVAAASVAPDQPLLCLSAEGLLPNTHRAAVSREASAIDRPAAYTGGRSVATRGGDASFVPVARSFAKVVVREEVGPPYLR